MTTFIQTQLISHTKFGLFLFRSGFSGDAPPLDLDLGYYNCLKLKFIWISRFLMEDQFLLSTYEKQIHADIRKRLDIQYRVNNITAKELHLNIPVVDFNTISAELFHQEYVLNGRPVVIKNYNFNATNEWTAEYISTHYGNHTVAVVNMNTSVTFNCLLSDFYQMSLRGDPVYIRVSSGLFDKYPVSMLVSYIYIVC